MREDTLEKERRSDRIKEGMQDDTESIQEMKKEKLERKYAQGKGKEK